MALASRRAQADPAELVARVAASRRDILLRVNRRKLRWEDLEDCYSQATLELVARARRKPFESETHAQNALEQKLASRINDRRRAIGGRSSIETAIAGAVSVDAPGSEAGMLADPTSELLRQVSNKIELRRLREVANELSPDQRLVLACQLSLGMDCAEFCERFGWSSEKFRKVAQRARARLRVLIDEYQMGERCQRLEHDVHAVSAGVASAAQLARVGAHLENCRGCARALHQLDRSARRIAAVLPAPVGAKALLAWVAVVVHRLVDGRHAAAAGAAGGGAAGAAKLGAVAACVAGAVACVHTGLFGLVLQPPQPAPHRHAPVRAPHVARAARPVLQRAARAHRAPARHPAPVRRRPVVHRTFAPRRDFSFELRAGTSPHQRAGPSRAGPEFSLER